ncbi:MAG TPA: hypothetical protein VGC35_05990 [Allosphingosinicella sp.]|jgi:hypothetical protein
MQFAADGTLYVSWPGGDGKLGQTLARSHTLVVSLNHKMRVQFATVLKLTLEIGRQLDSALEEFPGFEAVLVQGPVSWDIQQFSLSAFRNEVATSDLPDNDKKRLLESRMPKHLWRIIAATNGGAVLELLLDATDLVQGEMLIDTVVYARNAANLFGIVFKHADYRFDTSPRTAASGAHLPISLEHPGVDREKFGSGQTSAHIAFRRSAAAHRRQDHPHATFPGS